MTAQLIDPTMGLHLWAVRYDRNLEDIFAIQDEIMREIVVALNVELREGEPSWLRARGISCVRLVGGLRPCGTAQVPFSESASSMSAMMLDG